MTVRIAFMCSAPAANAACCSAQCSLAECINHVSQLQSCLAVASALKAATSIRSYCQHGLLLMQASMQTLQAVSHQLTIRVVPGIVPDMPVVPSDNSIKHVLLQPCLLFVTAVCKKQSRFDKVAHLARAALHNIRGPLASFPECCVVSPYCIQLCQAVTSSRQTLDCSDFLFVVTMMYNFSAFVKFTG